MDRLVAPTSFIMPTLTVDCPSSVIILWFPCIVSSWSNWIIINVQHILFHLSSLYMKKKNSVALVR
jgi:hypothetical protein